MHALVYWMLFSFFFCFTPRVPSIYTRNFHKFDKFTLALPPQVACSTEGASFLLEAGVVDRLTESEGMARASQIATEATKLGALGVANGGDVSALSFGAAVVTSKVLIVESMWRPITTVGCSHNK